EQLGEQYDWVALVRPDLLLALDGQPICSYKRDAIYRVHDYAHLIPRRVAMEYLTRPMTTLRRCRQGDSCCG
ncbi:unnamed protein product, partial [Polarella glacialis]